MAVCTSSETVRVAWWREGGYSMGKHYWSFEHYWVSLSHCSLRALWTELQTVSAQTNALYCTGLFRFIAVVLTTCHTQYTWDSSICIVLFNRTTLQVFVTYLTGALYVHHLWFYKHQHDNQVHSTQNAFSLPFATILVNCAPSGEMHNYCTPHILKENFANFLIHRCNYILLSEVYCIWQVVKTLTVILNNPVYCVFYC